MSAGGEEGPVHSAGLLVAREVEWPVVDLRADWDDAPILDVRRAWEVYEPQVDDYVRRALDPGRRPRSACRGSAVTFALRSPSGRFAWPRPSPPRRCAPVTRAAARPCCRTGGSPRSTACCATCCSGLRRLSAGWARRTRQYSALVRDTLRRGRGFDREPGAAPARRDGGRLPAGGRRRAHARGARRAAYGVYARDSSCMTPFGAIICQLANPRRRGEYATTLRFSVKRSVVAYSPRRGGWRAAR